MVASKRVEVLRALETLVASYACTSPTDSSTLQAQQALARPSSNQPERQSANNTPSPQARAGRQEGTRLESEKVR